MHNVQFGTIKEIPIQILEMQYPPASVILSWPTPNYDHPDQLRPPTILVISCIFFPIAVFMVGLRSYTRLRLSKSFGIDDALLLIALLPAAGYTILSCLAVTRFGCDRHVWGRAPEPFFFYLEDYRYE